MPLSFAGNLDRPAVWAAVDQLTQLVGSAEVGEAWDDESVLPGMTVGGLVRHLVSQPECAVEFLSTPGPPDAPVLTLVGHYDRVDWLHAAVDHLANTSICDDFNEMAAAGPAESVEVLRRSLQQSGAAIDGAGPTTYVPWQNYSLPTDDFLVVRLMEIMVHADDLAQSVGVATPLFGSEVLEPALALLAALSVRPHGQGPVLRALSREQRSTVSPSAFSSSQLHEATRQAAPPSTPGEAGRPTGCNSEGMNDRSLLFVFAILSLITAAWAGVSAYQRRGATTAPDRRPLVAIMVANVGLLVALLFVMAQPS